MGIVFTVPLMSDAELYTNSYTFFGNNIGAAFQKPVHRNTESSNGFLCSSLQLSLEKSRGIGVIQTF